MRGVPYKKGASRIVLLSARCVFYIAFAAGR